MSENTIHPAEGCIVVTSGGHQGFVQRSEKTDLGVRIRVKLSNGNVTSRPLQDLESALDLDMDVKHIPSLPTQQSLGIGTVRDVRTIAHRQQALVEFPEIGKILWLPHERLVPVPTVYYRFIHGRQKKNEAERVRLRSLARALENWNENTGTLSHLDIAPLPHQIHLVHHILRSGNLNWMIADDVGLGKTIEIGMLMSALKQRGTLRRVLLVVPAGLVRQWKEEMRHKFGLKEFRIYGVDFQINYPDEWKLYTHVIGSVDRLKHPEHTDQLLQSGTWDLIVFDEAHRLSRRQYGRKLDATGRYKLATRLRPLSESLLLLTATPHQGMQDKFQSLLELLRPDLKKEILMLNVDQSILSEIVFRNPKSEVTDHNGQLIFQGKDTHSITIELNDHEINFDQQLKEYLKKGYAASESRGNQGRAVGFVMTVYRKLASSSYAAIEQALIRRLSRLEEAESIVENFDPEEQDHIDERYLGEWEEEQISIKAKEFFAGEKSTIQKLIKESKLLKQFDSKFLTLIEEIIPSILSGNQNEKVLIFTEYRTTQDYLKEGIVEKYGAEKVAIICGGQSFEKREEVIDSFENEVQFLISTEAGGEGINLQRKCHIMINYDLPWNPMRMVQRIGRLYRYGQKKRVIVFNLQAPQNFDSSIVELMYRRLEDVSRDMATIGTEFQEGLADEILGELSEVMDVEELLKKSRSFKRSRTEDEINEAIEQAQKAIDLERELFSSAQGFNRDELTDALKIDTDHLQSFLEGMLNYHKISITQRTNRGRILHLKIPEYMSEKYPLLRQSHMKITVHRDLSNRFQHIDMFDFNHPLMQIFSKSAKSSEFGGYFAFSYLPRTQCLVSVILRWQNEHGRRMREEFVAVKVDEKGRVVYNPYDFSEWLLAPAKEYRSLSSQPFEYIAENVKLAIEDRLEHYSNPRLHPENQQWISSLWSHQNE